MNVRFIWLALLVLGLAACRGSDNPNAAFDQESGNNPPVASKALKRVELNEDSRAEFSLAGSDPDGDPISFEIVDDVPETAGHLYMTGEGRTLFEPAPDFNGETAFSFRVFDGTGFSDPVTVTLAVQPVPDIRSISFRNGSGAEPWVTYPVDPATGTIQVSGLLYPQNLDAPFTVNTDEGGAESVTYQVVHSNRVSGLTLNADGSGSINTADTGVGIAQLELTATGANGTSPPVRVDFDAAMPLYSANGFSKDITFDALNLSDHWGRYRTAQPAASVTFNLDLVHADLADPTQYPAFTAKLENLNVPRPEDVRIDLYVHGVLKQANLTPNSEITFDQYAFDPSLTDDVQLVIRTMADPQILSFDMSFPHTQKTSFRGTMCSEFSWFAPVFGTNVYLNAFCSNAQAASSSSVVACTQVQCMLTNTSTNEQASCYQTGGNTYQCDVLDGSGNLTHTCTSTTGATIKMCQGTFVINPTPITIPEPTTSIVVSVPDGGEYMGSDAIYKGSLSSPASRTILEGAVTGSVSGPLVDGFLTDFQAFLNSDSGSDAAVANYVNALMALNLSPEQALGKMLDDVQLQTDAVPAAAVLAHLLPKWGLGLAKQPLDSLNGDERALIGLFMYQINQRRDELVTTAEARLQAYRESQKQCLGLSCVFMMEGFPTVIDDTIHDVDTRWIDALGAGAASGVVATAALSTVLVTVGMVSVHAIFPHAASIALTSVTGGLMALPVTVVVVAAVATVMAVDNLFTAQANEDAYNAFIAENSVRYTDQSTFLGHDYSTDDRVMGEFVIAGQKVLMQVLQ